MFFILTSYGVWATKMFYGHQVFILLDYAEGQLRCASLELSTWVKIIGSFGINIITDGGILYLKVCLLNLDGVLKLEACLGEVCVGGMSSGIIWY